MSRFSSLRARLWLLVLLAVLPVLGLILYTDLEQRRLAAAQAQEDALRLAWLAAADQAELIQGTHQLLSALAQLPAVRDGDSGTCTALFTDLLKRYPAYANLGAIRSNGEVFCSAAPFTQPLNVSGFAWFRRVVQSRDFTVGEYQRSAISSEFILVLGYPMLDAANHVQAVVAASLDLGRLNQLAAQARLPQGATLTAVDRNGTIVARYPDPQRWVGLVLPEAPIIKAMLTQGEGTAEVPDVDSIRRLYAFTQVRGVAEAGMYVSIGIPTEVAFAVANQRLVRNLATLGVITVLMLGAVWIGSNLLILRQVNALVSATKRLRAGDVSARTGLPKGHGELDQLAAAFDDMAETLEQREAERKHAEETMQMLSSQLLEAQESERRRLAHELHDELGQGLTAVKLGLQMIEGDPNTASEQLQESIELVDGILQQVRNLSLDLRPSLLDDLGLAATLDWYVKRQAERTGLVTHLSVEPLEPRPSPTIETACFRLIQEALTNVTRHAQAREVWVEVRQHAGTLHIHVQDDGVGFDVRAAQERAAQGGSLGVLGMEERVRLVGGDLEIISMLGCGTDIRARVPLGQESSFTPPPSAAPRLSSSPAQAATSERQKDMETCHDPDSRPVGR